MVFGRSPLERQRAREIVAAAIMSGRGDFERDVAGVHQASSLKRQFVSMNSAKEIGGSVSQNLPQGVVRIIARPFQLDQPGALVRWIPIDEIDAAFPVPGESPIPEVAGHWLNHLAMYPLFASMATAFSSIISLFAL